MINARGTTNGSAYAMWSVMLYGTFKQTDHGCTSCPTSMLSLRSQPLSSALLLKNKPREQHECTNLMHSDLDPLEPRFEHLHLCHVPRRDDPFVTQGGIKANPPTHHQREGLSITPERRVGGGSIDGRSHVGLVAFHHHIPRTGERTCERKPIPERGR